MKQKFYRKRRRKQSAFGQPVPSDEPAVKGFYTDDDKRVRPLVEPLPKPKIPPARDEPLRGPKPRWLTQREWDQIQALSYKGDEAFPSYRTNYIGSKQKIVPVIMEETHPEVRSVFDAFGGSNVVGWNFKKAGYQVFTNDRLKYSYHISRAIVENNHVRLSRKDIKMLLKPNQSRTFVQENFHDAFFTPGILREIDTVRNNCDNLRGYKRDLALASLGRTCVDVNMWGHFTVTKHSGSADEPRASERQSIKDFRRKFIEYAHMHNSLVIDNGMRNKAYCMDVNRALRKESPDLVYFDPPYVTEFTSKGYEVSYHFVEGLMTHWRGKHLDHSTKTKMYKERAKPLSRDTIYPFFEDFIQNSDHVDHVIISYRNKAYPRGAEIKHILERNGKAITKCRWIRHQYSASTTNGKRTPACYAIEYLFIADASPS